MVRLLTKFNIESVVETIKYYYKDNYLDRHPMRFSDRIILLNEKEISKPKCGGIYPRNRR